MCPSFLSVVGVHSVGREWVGLILAIFLGNAFPWRCPILTQSGRRDYSDGRSGVSSGLVRRSLHPLPEEPSYVAPVTGRRAR